VDDDAALLALQNIREEAIGQFVAQITEVE